MTKRTIRQSDQSPCRKLHLDIFEALAQTLSLNDLWELEFRKDLPSYPNFLVSKQELNKCLMWLLSRDHIVKTAFGYSSTEKPPVIISKQNSKRISLSSSVDQTLSASTPTSFPVLFNNPSLDVLVSVSGSTPLALSSVSGYTPLALPSLLGSTPLALSFVSGSTPLILPSLSDSTKEWLWLIQII